MFAVHFGIWIKCKDGELDYERSTHLPFAPYPGLDIEDEALGEFELLQVRWSEEDECFYCFSNYLLFESRSMRWLKHRLKQAGWTKVEFTEVIEVKPRKGEH
jgi:hypothetical protein